MTVWVVLLRSALEDETRVAGVFSSKAAAERFVAALDDPNAEIVEPLDVIDSPQDTAWARATEIYAQFAADLYPPPADAKS